VTSRCQGLFPPHPPSREKPWERGWVRSSHNNFALFATGLYDKNIHRKFTNFKFIFIILWQKASLTTKTKTFTDPKLFTKEIVLVVLITLARL